MLNFVLIIIAAALIYWLYRTRLRGKAPAKPNPERRRIQQSELSELKNTIPPGYYMSILAMAKSDMSARECVEELDELIAKMKEDNIDPTPVEKLVLKIEQDLETQ